MAKIIAPFLIKGTIDSLNFVVNADGSNYARLKGTSALTSEVFRNNPKYEHIRKHGLEFGYCAKKSKIFRELARKFNDLAKDGSFAGRVNKILLEILQEDESQPKGSRTLCAALNSNENLADILLDFEANKLRPLSRILKTKFEYNFDTKTIVFKNFNPLQHLDWPEDATHVHIAVAASNWDYENGLFETNYSEDILLEKDSITCQLSVTIDYPTQDKLSLLFLFIGFAKQERRKYKMLHRKFNTNTIIYAKKF